MTDTSTPDPRRIVIDAYGPAVLLFDRRDGYYLEVGGQRVRVDHLREALASYDAATGTDGAQDGGPTGG